MIGALRSHGVALPELLIVLCIMGIVAAAAIPIFSSDGTKRIDVAATEVATALRYARSEALRSGEVHGVEINQDTQHVVVYKANLTTNPVSMAAILPHPVDRKPYDLDFDTAMMTTGVIIGNDLDSFLYGAVRNKNLLFDTTGAPIWIVSSTETIHPLQDGMIRLVYGTQQRTVRVAPYTGRVTVE